MVNAKSMDDKVYRELCVHSLPWVVIVCTIFYLRLEKVLTNQSRHMLSYLFKSGLKKMRGFTVLFTFVNCLFLKKNKIAASRKKRYILFPPRIELRTFSVLGRPDNHYTMETLPNIS